jgi:hypothetical protein
MIAILFRMYPELPFPAVMLPASLVPRWPLNAVVDLRAGGSTPIPEKLDEQMDDAVLNYDP